MVQANVALSNDGGKLRDRFYNRIMFPINDPQGECIAFGGRVVGKGEPKYLNSQETPLFHKSQVLYGMDKAKAAMASTGIAVVVEGYTDVIALHEAGVRNAVATLGTALTMRHIRLLSRHAQHRIVYLFDGDEAGQRAADRALAFIDDSMTPEAGKSRIELAAVTLPDNLDPADFVAQRGAEELQKLIANAQPLLKYGIERRLARHDLSRAEGRAAALADALQVLAPIKDSMLARDYAVQIATSVRAREQDVIDQLEHLKAPKAEGERDDESAPEGFERAVAPRRPARNLPRAEINRRRFERQLLTLAARRPDLALLHADALAQTQWHEQAHAAIAQSMLDVLAEDPAASSARLVTEASRALPDAAAVLTSGTVSETAAPEQLAAFLVEELAIGDAEDAVGALRAQIADPSRLDPDELEMLYEAVAAMQQDLKRRRAAHKPLSPRS
ncbi:MAG: DNA primase [Eggerthella lenta]